MKLNHLHSPQSFAGVSRPMKGIPLHTWLWCLRSFCTHANSGLISLSPKVPNPSAYTKSRVYSWSVGASALFTVYLIKWTHLNSRSIVTRCLPQQTFWTNRWRGSPSRQHGSRIPLRRVKFFNLHTHLLKILWCTGVPILLVSLSYATSRWFHAFQNYLANRQVQSIYPDIYPEQISKLKANHFSLWYPQGNLATGSSFVNQLVSSPTQ